MPMGKKECHSWYYKMQAEEKKIFEMWL